MEMRSGRCLCGACRYEVTVTDLKARACHCDDCQRWTGSAVYVLGPFADIRLHADAPLQTHESSPWAERSFCRICGSALLWRAKISDEYCIMVGSLEDQTGIELVEEIFCDMRSPVLSAHAGARQKKRADVIDHYKVGSTYDGRELEQE